MVSIIFRQSSDKWENKNIDCNMHLINLAEPKSTHNRSQAKTRQFKKPPG